MLGVPSVIKPLIEQYFSLMRTHVPHLLAGFYLHGSIALGAFDEKNSDIDYIAVLARKPTETEIKVLAEVHRQLAQKYPKLVLEGSYLQWQDLGRFPGSIEPYPYYRDGTFYPSGHFEMNSVTWWVLKQHGIAVLGPEPEELDFIVNWDLLIRNMAVNLNTYWLQWTKNPRRIAALLTDYGIQWAILGVSRQSYTFQEEEIVSKLQAGEYALVHTPDRWHRIIQEALNIRLGKKESLYRSRIMRMKDALSFLKYTINFCNGLLKFD